MLASLPFHADHMLQNSQQRYIRIYIRFNETTDPSSKTLRRASLEDAFVPVDRIFIDRGQSATNTDSQGALR